MLKQLLICLAIITTTTLQAQDNLVPNPSFEELKNDSCNLSPTNYTETTSYWFTASRTPGLYNVCGNANAPFFGVPKNFSGFQYPINGLGYMGLYTYWLGQNFQNSLIGGNKREWAGIKLKSPLVKNGIYCVYYYVSLSDTCFIATPPPQMYFSNDSIVISNNELANFSDYQNDYLADFSNDIVYDTVNWTKVSGEYIAKGDEQYVYIGNFYDYLHTPWDTIRNNPDINDFIFSYFYIDSVSIIKCGIANSIENIPYKNAVKIHPNPAMHFVTVALNANTVNGRIELYDYTGKRVLSQALMAQYTTVDLPASLTNGLYYARIINNGAIVASEKLVITR